MALDVVIGVVVARLDVFAIVVFAAVAVDWDGVSSADVCLDSFDHLPDRLPIELPHR